LGVIGNRQGFLGEDYPEYADYPGIGGKLYRQGLIKMNEFVTQCGRDRVPMIWFQDTSGIDVGDIAEKAELLGLGQSLIYSIQQTDVPMMLVVLRKGTAAAHYVMGGPTANRHNAFTLGTATSEIYVMHGETAAAASFSRRLVKEKDAGRPLKPVIDHEPNGPGIPRQLAPHLLRPPRIRGRGGQDAGPETIPAGLCRRLLPEPQIDLPASPHDAARARQPL
jgi:glutaconyl-CoA decarboxylase